jgi:hypothetical protein
MRIFYFRSTSTVSDAEGAIGRRGILLAGDLGREVVLHTIERADRYKWLRPGIYDCVCAMWGSKHSNAKAIRVLGAYSKGRIYIHPSNWPHELTGCVAPGLQMRSDGVGPSRPAMKKLFKAIGGFELGRELKLEVQGLPSLPVWT